MQEKPVSEELLAILVCPETKLPVTLAPDSVIAGLNSLISSGALKKKSGQTVKEVINSGLMREDSKVLYPIIGGIPVMLIEEGIIIDRL